MEAPRRRRTWQYVNITKWPHAHNIQLHDLLVVFVIFLLILGSILQSII
jgi:hypothetical protein